MSISNVETAPPSDQSPRGWARKPDRRRLAEVWRRGIGAPVLAKHVLPIQTRAALFNKFKFRSGTRPASAALPWHRRHIERLGTECTSNPGQAERTVFGTPRLRTGGAPDRSNCQGRFTSECWPMPLVLLMLLPGMFVAGFASGFGVRARISRQRRRKRAAARLPGRWHKPALHAHPNASAGSCWR